MNKVDLEMKTFNDFVMDLNDLNTYKNLKQYIPLYMNKNPDTKRNCKIQRFKKRFNPLYDLDENNFKLKYRFKKDNIRRIIEVVRDDLEADHCIKNQSDQVPVDLQIMAAIRFWGFTEHPELTALDHGVSLRTLYKICKRVAGALSSNASRFIRMPATFFEKECVTNGFQALAGMPHVIGSVSHYVINLNGRNGLKKSKDIVISNQDQMLIQIISDVSLKIRDIDCKLYPYGHKCQPSEMLINTRIKERFEQNEFRDRVLIGDKTLTCSSFLFTPIQCPNTSEEYIFNQTLSASFRPAIQCISMWKERFQILSTDFFSSYYTTKNTIVALALLHNMGIDWKDRIVGSETGIRFSSYSFHNVLKINQKLSDTNARTEFIKHNF